jgi:hypothetical protein
MASRAKVRDQTGLDSCPLVLGSVVGLAEPYSEQVQVAHVGRSVLAEKGPQLARMRAVVSPRPIRSGG